MNRIKIEKALRPCPFCGSSRDDFVSLVEYKADVYRVKCFECGAESGKCETILDAVDEWNRRADEND